MLGSLTRYSVNEICRSRWPEWSGLGTLTVNLAGCLAIGWILAPRPDQTGPLSEPLRLFLVTGILGGLTTFSSFANETVDLWAVNQRVWSVTFFTANLLLGMLCIGCGRWLGGFR